MDPITSSEERTYLRATRCTAVMWALLAGQLTGAITAAVTAVATAYTYRRAPEVFDGCLPAGQCPDPPHGHRLDWATTDPVLAITAGAITAALTGILVYATRLRTAHRTIRHARHHQIPR